MNRKTLLATVVPLALAPLAVAFVLRTNVLAGPNTPVGVPGRISYQGCLTDDAGQPISGTVDLNQQLLKQWR